MPEHQNIPMRSHPTRRRPDRSTAGGVGLVVGGVAIVAALVLVVWWALPHAHTSSNAASTTRPPGASTASATAAAAAPKPKAHSATAASKKTEHKPAAKPAKATPAPKPATPPLGMARLLPGSRQLVVATAETLSSTQGTLRIFQLESGGWKQVLSAPCRFGTNGLIDGTQRREGSRTTPTGIWWPGTFVWGWHGTPPLGTKMPYRQTTADVYWSDERNSTYNTWVDSSQQVSGEHLVAVRVQYEYAWSTGYNASPNQVVQGRGTAIFLHIFDPPDYHNGLSAGCVTVSRADILRVFRTLDPSLKPSFAVGTQAPGTPTSIASY